jgi:hypothetical protein
MWGSSWHPSGGRRHGSPQDGGGVATNEKGVLALRGVQELGLQGQRHRPGRRRDHRAAFGKIISSFVENVIMPLVSLVRPNAKDYEEWGWTVGDTTVP